MSASDLSAADLAAQLKARGVHAVCNDPALSAGMDTVRFDYVTATRADGSLLAIALDFGSCHTLLGFPSAEAFTSANSEDRYLGSWTVGDGDALAVFGRVFTEDPTRPLRDEDAKAGTTFPQLAAWFTSAAAEQTRIAGELDAISEYEKGSEARGAASALTEAARQVRRVVAITGQEG